MTEPIWRRDFPYTADGEDLVTRRDFTRYLLAGSGAFAAAGVGMAAWTSLRDLPGGSERAIASVADVREGASLLFRYPRDEDPAVLLHLAGGELVAYSQKCTHLGCVVYWSEPDEQLICPCHEGHFAARTGEAVAGPPERPLPRISLDVRDGTIWATGIER